MPEEEAKPDDETRRTRLKGAPVKNRPSSRESLVKPIRTSTRNPLIALKPCKLSIVDSYSASSQPSG